MARSGDRRRANCSALVGLKHLTDPLPADDAGFSLRVPRGFVARMRHGDAVDPLLLQVLPQLAERDRGAGLQRAMR